MDNLTENELSYVIRGSIIKVYRSLGPGLLESVYEMALAYELKKKDVMFNYNSRLLYGMMMLN